VIPWCDYVDLLVLEDVEGVFALWITGIVQSIAFNTIACVD